jgi:hypothetical protein
MAKFETMADIQAEKRRIETAITKMVRQFEADAPGAIIEEIRLSRPARAIEQRRGELVAEMRIEVD